MKKEYFERIDLLRFPLIVLVVFIHAYTFNMVPFRSELGLSYQFQNVISNGIARSAVPLFFLFSGYLYFLNFDGTIIQFKHKTLSRMRTLVGPLIFWNVLVLLVFYITQTFHSLTELFSGDKIVRQFEFIDYCNAIIGCQKSPLAYQFWFIRDLIFVSVIVPLIYVMLNFKLKVTLLCLLFFVWFFNFVSYSIPSTVSLLFFLLGGFIAEYYRNKLFIFDSFKVYVYACYTLFLTVLALSDSFDSSYIQRINELMGVITLLCFSSQLHKNHRSKTVLVSLAPISFFIFCIHEPLLTIIKKIVLIYFDLQSAMENLLFYFGVTLFVIYIGLKVRSLITIIFPRVFYYISGK